MRSIVFLLAVLVSSQSYGQCIGNKCFGRPATVNASASVVEHPILNRTVAESRVVHQEPIFDGHLVHAVQNVVHHVANVVHHEPVYSQPSQPVVHCNCQRQLNVQASASVSYSGSSIAQQKANQQASEGWMRHVGGSFGAGRYEGVGFSTVSADEAIRQCCYWGQRTPVDIGVQRGSNGWYATVLYQ